jgi:exosortase
LGDVPQVSQVAEVDRSSSGVDKWVWPWGVLTVLMAILYAAILKRLVHQWWADPNFSHGFFVPLFSAFLIWKDRERLQKLEAEPCGWGLVVIAFGLTTLIIGVLGAELLMSRTSLLFVIAGLIIYFRGWQNFRAVFFPWAFLFFMIPLPDLIMNHITIPLQFISSDLATRLLRMAGVPVLQNGNIIQLPNMALDVVEACSGIRSLISLSVLAIIYGYLLESSYVIRALLLAASVPIAVLANGLRIMGTGLTGLYWEPSKAQGFFHEFSGWVIFLTSLATLYIFHQLLRALARLGRRLNA